MSETIEPDDFDSPWKIVLERFFRAFIAFFFPNAHDDIDWDRGYEFLDKELQEVTRDAELGRRLVDKLVKVWLKDGNEAWVIIHIEVQGQSDAGFAERMFVYHYRVYDQYRVRVASFAVLADTSKSWRPDHFGYDLWGSQIELRFPSVKLLDYEHRWEELEASDNPFAVVVMAHLKTQETQHDPEERSRWKLRIAKGLYERGWSREDILEMFRFLDWIMRLPEELEQGFKISFYQYEEEKKMRYYAPIEVMAEERGIQQGIRESILEFLEFRFGASALSLAERIRAIQDASALRELRTAATRVSSLEEFRHSLPSA